MIAATRYQRLYARLLHLYPKSHRERFGEGMEQTFNDLCRERGTAGKGLFGLVLWVFAETSARIVKENLAVIIMQNITRRLSAWVIIVAVLLMIPLVAMQFTDEVHWTLLDFGVAGSLLFGSALVYELATRNMTTPKYRVAVGFAVMAALLYLWAELAVGIFTNWGS